MVTVDRARDVARTLFAALSHMLMNGFFAVQELRTAGPSMHHELWC
jgi:hypothetical protein